MPAERENEQVEEIGGKTYRAFLVRCWQEEGAGKKLAAWRFTLVLLDNGQSRRGFACLDDLVAYLHVELGEGSVSKDRDGG